MSSTTASSADFEAHRSILEDMYWDQGKTMRKVMKDMKDVYHFGATYSYKTYKYYLTDKWGKKKKTNKKESLAMLEIRKRRRVEENKETVFTRLDRDVEDINLNRFAKRHKLEIDDNTPLPETRVATPPNIRYRTPDIDTPNNCPSPASEEEQAFVEESHGSYGAHSLQSGAMPSTWQYGDTCVGPQPSHHTNMPIQFTANPIPGYPMSHEPQGFSQNIAGPTFHRSPYRGHTELPSHTSNILADGLSSWGYNPQPPQPASRALDFGTVASVPFYAATQTLGTIHTPELALGIPGNNIPLHDAVVGDSVHPVGAMLPNGVDSGSTMAFSHTDNDTLGAVDQDDVGDELDVLDNMVGWPNREARPM
ncbi:uncharacterized protein B0H64DRAFT_175011 [Chaetomium fimeti]|uniref:Clr5 domain-containing protein n=1 Tax=Chaetomium fimeti TaxID=1854472 RepID=A0AAE0LR87_9PEZI|nr:hypothetical protein B0H64DRAFT_175011 [Chaetomium fimeti]